MKKLNTSELHEAKLAIQELYLSLLDEKDVDSLSDEEILMVAELQDIGCDRDPMALVEEICVHEKRAQFENNKSNRMLKRELTKATGRQHIPTRKRENSAPFYMTIGKSNRSKLNAYESNVESNAPLKVEAYRFTNFVAGGDVTNSTKLNINHRTVLRRVAMGIPAKQIASELSIKTSSVHILYNQAIQYGLSNASPSIKNSLKPKSTVSQLTPIKNHRRKKTIIKGFT